MERHAVAGYRGHAAMVLGEPRHGLKLGGNLVFGIRVAGIEQRRHPLVNRSRLINAFGAIPADRSFAHQKIADQTEHRHDGHDQNPGQCHTRGAPYRDDAQCKKHHHQRVQEQI